MEQQAKPGPTRAEDLVAQGKELEQKGELQRAVAHYRRAIEADQTQVEAFHLLGDLLYRQGEFALAAKLFQHALAVDPANAETNLRLAEVLSKQGRADVAKTHYRRALRRDPESARAEIGQIMGQLPIIYRDTSEIDRSRRAYRRYLKRLAGRVQAMTTLERAKFAEVVGIKQPFYLAYQGKNDCRLQRTYGEMVADLMAARYPKFSQQKFIATPWDGGEIRVGIVSRFFRNHSNWKIPIKGWVENLDRTRFKLFGYHTGPERDDATIEAERSFFDFVQAPHRVQDWCERIASDRLHVLIFPEFGMDPVTVQLGCLRHAPVQMTSWGHPETSGLPTIDYFLSSDLMEPKSADAHYSERLVRLPNLSIHYAPLQVEPVPLPRDAIGADPDDVLYWCGQTLYKYLPQHDDVFPRIAAQQKRSKFLFIKLSTDREDHLTAVFRERLERVFAEAGLNYSEHCIFLDQMSPADFAGAVSTADIFLDSIGWSGCNSTLEAIAYDLPVVTLPGKMMRGRHSFAILKMMGISETIAVDVDDYIRLAVLLGQDKSFRQRIRELTTEKKHRLYNDVSPIRALEDVMESAVRRHTATGS